MKIHQNLLAKELDTTIDTLRKYLSRAEFTNCKRRGIIFLSQEQLKKLTDLIGYKKGIYQYY